MPTGSNPKLWFGIRTTGRRAQAADGEVNMDFSRRRFRQIGQRASSSQCSVVMRPSGHRQPSVTGQHQATPLLVGKRQPSGVKVRSMLLRYDKGVVLLKYR